MTISTLPETSLVGVGLGLRLKLAKELLSAEKSSADFLEIAPENYLRVGGERARLLDAARERWPVVCHGLAGDLAGAAPLDLDLLQELRGFLRRVGACWYSDHLCFTHVAGGEFHDLLPLPFSFEAGQRAAQRIREVRELLELPMAVENISAYARMPGGEMDEPDFVRFVVEESDSLLLLDVNNVYVNSVNFGFDPREYISRLPLDRVVQIHIAGHAEERPGLLIDTHGAPIIDPVYALLEWTLPR
ncbi:MAG: DUF692 domain-containing protein, partial [Myxococcota bacterium]